MLADEDQAHCAVTVLVVPDFAKFRAFGKELFLFGFAFGSKPTTEILGAGLLAGLFEQVAIVTFVAEPN